MDEKEQSREKEKRTEAGEERKSWELDNWDELVLDFKSCRGHNATVVGVLGLKYVNGYDDCPPPANRSWNTKRGVSTTLRGRKGRRKLCNLANRDCDL